MKSRQDIVDTKRWVIKIGSALLTNDGRGLDNDAMQQWVAQIIDLRKQGIECILVSSGAVAEGMKRLGWTSRPREVHSLQAAAAVGQMGLVQSWESCFSKHQVHTAQVLLTHDDLSNRQRYLNARSTLRELLSLGVVPVVNENDSVVTDEIRFGDNDTLAALVANLVEAELLVILTDQDGLFDADPRMNKQARLISEGNANDSSLLDVAGEGSALGRGGMYTKVKAAQLAARSGAATMIASGREPACLKRIHHGDELGSLLLAETEILASRKQWLAGHLNMRGSLTLDNGAVAKLRSSGCSLLAVGISNVEGDFARGEMVRCIDSSGKEVARGLINYNSDECRTIMGKASERIESLLGYVADEEVIHRDNMVIL